MSVEAARAAMLGAALEPSRETVALRDALGRTLAEDVTATRDQPPFDGSAMDGWAVRAADGEGPRRIIGESAAGRSFGGEVGPGEAVRIFTGAPLPAGADAVVIQEDARVEDGRVLIPPPSAGRHIRRAGNDFRAGERLLSAGDRLDPWRLSLAAAAGRAELAVARRPGVAILGGGDEIVPAGSNPGPDQIFDFGGPALAALVAIWGGTPLSAPPLGDDLDAIEGAVRNAGGDLLVTVGGASVGDHDLVKPALGRLGLELAVESVAMRPGKPTWFGRLTDGRRVLGLPGNPASALVAAELFLKPLIRAALGADPEPRLVRARIEAGLPANGPREHWLRAETNLDETGVLWAKPFSDQDLGRITIFAKSNALLRREPGAPAVEAGEPVDVLALMRADGTFR